MVETPGETSGEQDNIYDVGAPPPKKKGLGKIIATINVPAGESIGIGVQHDDETNSNIVSGMKQGIVFTSVYYFYSSKGFFESFD